MSQHRRRVPGKRRASRHKTGVVFRLTAGVAALVAVAAAAVYLVGLRPSSADTAGGALAAVMAVPTSHAMGVLENQRKQLIAMSAASHTFHLVGKPKLASRKPSSLPGAASASSGGGSAAGPPAAPPNPGTAQSIAYNMLSSFGWSTSQFSCLNNIWTRESGWMYNAENPSGAYGIPQALPADKMASAGPDWMTNPATQIKWGLGYIQSTYGSPCNAWAFWQAHDYY